MAIQSLKILALLVSVLSSFACKTPIDVGNYADTSEAAVAYAASQRKPANHTGWAVSTLNGAPSEAADWAQETLNEAGSERSDWARVSKAQTLKTGDPIRTQPVVSGAVPAVLLQPVSVEATALPLHRLFDGLAKQLSLSWQASEELDVSVTWSLPEQPANRLLDKLAARFNLEWSLVDGVLHVQGPAAFTAFYSVDYLNLERNFHSSVGLATQVGTMRGVDETGSQGAENSSVTTIENLSSQHFWASLKQDVDLLLADEGEGARWSINQDTGLISLLASPNMHRKLVRYLEHVAVSSRRQVLIEASVVEVLLSDKFEAGIDWQLLARGISGITAIQQFHGLGPFNATNADQAPTPSGLVTLSEGFGFGDINATLKLLEEFGEARIVSRPQIIAMNNQPAVLKVVDNRVYFTVNVERQQSADITERFTQTQIHTVPVGLVMNVTPQISADNSVMLNVRPSLSRILGFVDDPNPDLNRANVSNGVPEIQVREMESVLHVPSGSTAIIGGLMQSVQEDRDRQIPGASRVPVLGSLFGQQKRSSRRTELFIVLKPTVIDQSGASNEVRRLF